VPLKYPPGKEWMRGLYRNRPCSSFRLPDILPYDSIILSDTDIIFLRNIAQLWLEMPKFNGSAVVSMVPRNFPRPNLGLRPFQIKTGVKAGLMLMNLTRMRNIQWTQKVIEGSLPYLSQIQDGEAE